MILFEIFAVILLCAVIIGYVLFVRKRRITGLAGTLDMSLFSIKMPKYRNQREKEIQDIKQIIGMMEQVYSNFLNLRQTSLFRKIFYPEPRVALEIASETGGRDIVFYIAVPKEIETSLEKYVQGVYPEAVLERAPKDYTVFEPNGESAGSYMKLEKSVFFPHRLISHIYTWIL